MKFGARPCKFQDLNCKVEKEKRCELTSTKMKEPLTNFAHNRP